MSWLGLARARLESARALSAQIASSRLGLAQSGLAWFGLPQLILGRLGMVPCFPHHLSFPAGRHLFFVNLSGQHPPIKQTHPNSTKTNF